MKLSEEKQAKKRLNEKVKNAERAERCLSPKEKLELGFGRRGIAVSVTLVCCVLILCGGMLLVTHLRSSENYYELPDNTLPRTAPAAAPVVVGEVETGFIYNNPPEGVIQNNRGTAELIVTSGAATQRNPYIDSQAPDSADSPETAPSGSAASRSPQTTLTSIPERGYSGEVLFG